MARETSGEELMLGGLLQGTHRAGKKWETDTQAGQEGQQQLTAGVTFSWFPYGGCEVRPVGPGCCW